jgi:cell division septal protein FtsQ
LRKGKTIQQRYGSKKSPGMGLKRKLAILVMILCILSGAFVIGGIIVYKGLGQSDFFQITATRIEGCHRTTKNLILELSGVDIHSNLLALDLTRVEKSIESHQWVESVDIERGWPNQLKITVKEREPVAIASFSEGLFYIDKKGVAFAQVLPPEDMDYPVISGLDQQNWPTTVKGSPLGEALRFIRYAGHGSSILPSQNISELNLKNKDDIILFLVNRPFPIHLGKGKIRTKYYRLAKVLYRLYKKKEFSQIAYIHMSYAPNKVLVGFAGSV